MIKANFNSYASYVTDSLYQWDLNQKLRIQGLNLSVAPEVHFANGNVNRAVVKQATLDSNYVYVDIPNSLLQDPLTIRAYVGVYEGEIFKIIETIEIPVIPRKRPADYQIEDSDGEIYSFKALENAIANRATNARVDNIIAHNNDTEGNTELIDIRTGVNGTVYDSAGEAVRKQFLSTANTYNVTNNHPLESGYYSLTDAISIVPNDVRKTGLIITFRVDAKKWEQYQYCAKDTSDINWKNISYWLNNSYDSEYNNVYRGLISNLGHTSFDECTEYGYYRFLTADIDNITDRPENLVRGGNLFVYPYFAGTNAKFIRDLEGNEWFKYEGIDWICVNYNNHERISVLEKAMIKNDVSWCAMGDSITQGYYSYIENNNATYALDPSVSWVNYVAEKKGYTIVNKAIGGSGYLSIRSETKPVDNARTVADNTDFSDFNLVTLAYGVNDWKYNCVLGSISDNANNGDSIYSNMKYVIEKILSDNPLCKIIVITPLNCSVNGTYESNWGLGYSYSNNGTLDDIYNAIVEVCEYYGVEYIDMTHKSIVNRQNINNLLLDSVHPSKKCHEMIGKELSEKINI